MPQEIFDSAIALKDLIVIYIYCHFKEEYPKTLAALWRVLDGGSRGTDK
jgi:hypothetical protein